MFPGEKLNIVVKTAVFEEARKYPLLFMSWSSRANLIPKIRSHLMFITEIEISQEA